MVDETIYFNMSVLQAWSKLKAVIESFTFGTTKLKIRALFLVVVRDWRTDISVGKQQKSCCPSLEREGGCYVLGLKEIQCLICAGDLPQCLKSSGFWKSS